MNNPSRTALSISYNGREVSEKITRYIEDFDYIDNASGVADTIQVRLNDAEHKWVKDWFPKEGDYLQATIGIYNWGYQGDNRKLKCGKFLVDDFSFNGPPDVHILSAISTPINSDFVSTTKSKTWNKASIKGIAKSIADNAKVGLYFYGNDHSIDKVEQSDTSDMNFLFNLCKDYNLAMKLYNSKIIIFDEEKYEKKKAVGTIYKSMCTRWSLQSTLTGVYHGVSATFTDSKTNKTSTYDYLLNQGKRLFKMNVSAGSYAEAEIKAKAKLRAENKKAITVSLDMPGDTKYVAATCYDLKGFGKFNGKYYIDKVTHSLVGGYIVSLDMHRVLNT